MKDKPETLAQLFALSDDNSEFAFFSGAPLSRKGLTQRAEDMAGILQDAGVTKGSRVVLVSRTNALQLSAFAACWKLGAIVFPLDATKNLNRSLAMISPDLILLDPSTFNNQKNSIPEDYNVLELRGENFPAREVKTVLPEVEPNDPALCIYTSGSTGNPKGVVLSQNALLLGGCHVEEAKQLTEEDRVLCVLPLTHLNGLVTTFVAPFLSGGSVVYLQGPFESLKALQLIKDHACTWFSAVPTQYQTLMSPAIEGARHYMSSLRFCRSASAPLPAKLMNDFELHYGVPVIETMGMSETAGQIFSNPLGPEWREAGSIGQVVGFEARIINEDGEPCQSGELGELQIKGPAMMLGYLDDPEETAKAFDGPWLKSGDLALCDENGFYRIKGRKKDIAIFSGVNISLRFLEEMLREKFGDEMLCVGAEHTLFGEVVVVYLEEDKEDKEKLSKQIKKYLSEHLPHSHAFGEVRWVAQFPRSSVGKVLKHKLTQEEVLWQSKAELPTTAATLLAEVLGLLPDNVHKDMALGVTAGWDSLIHATIILAMEEIMGRQLSNEEIFALTTYPGIEAVFKGDLNNFDISQHRSEEELRRHKELMTFMSMNRTLPNSTALDKNKVHSPEAPLSFNTLVKVIEQTGLKRGDVVMLHSDISTLGLTEAGFNRQEVLTFYFDAFMKVLGEEGTLVMCTSFEDYGRYGTAYSVEESPSRLGAFSEFFRQRPEAVRSIHPILSVTAVGAQAEALCGGAHYDGFGYDSPWGRMHRVNARLMTLGMGHYPEMGLTFLHYIEQLYGVPYQYNKIFTAPVYKGGQQLSGEFTMMVRYLDYGITYANVHVRESMLAQNLAQNIPLQGNFLFSTTCNELVAHVTEELSKNRYYLLKDLPTFRPGDIPMDGQTGEMKYVYDKAKK